MRGDRIPEHDHISRYCKPRTVCDGQIQASAFIIRQGEESLSVNWLECLGCGDRESEIRQMREIYGSKFSGIGHKARIAILNVGEICKKVLTEHPDDSRNINVLHDPRENDPSHSGIYNLRPDDILIAELILSTIRTSNVHHARNPI
jgi:hypothetical protein